MAAGIAPRRRSGAPRRGISLAINILLVAAAAALPAFATDYQLSFATGVTITVLLLSSYRLMILTGEWSFAHVVLQGVGAYAAAVLAKRYDASFPVALVAGGFASALIAAVLSFPLLKMKGFYFLMGSFAAAEAIRLMWRKIDILGGTRGLSGVLPPEADFGSLNIDFGAPANFYWLALGVSVVCLWLLWRLEASRFGKILRALAQQDVLAQAVGVDTRRYRRAAFILSAAFAGVSGVLLVYAFGTVTPNRFNLNFALYLMIWAIVGGTRTFYGVIAGGIILMIFDEQLRFAEQLRPGFYGVVLIAVMMFAPGGLEQIVPKRLLSRLGGRPATPGVLSSSQGEEVSAP